AVTLIALWWWCLALSLHFFPVASFFLSMFFVGFTVLNPIERAIDGPILIHERHSRSITYTTFVWLLRPGTGRCWILTCNCRCASLRAFCTVVRLTPAMAAILSIGQSHTPCLLTSPDTMQRTARSP